MSRVSADGENHPSDPQVTDPNRRNPLLTHIGEVQAVAAALQGLLRGALALDGYLQGIDPHGHPLVAETRSTMLGAMLEAAEKLAELINGGLDIANLPLEGEE